MISTMIKLGKRCLSGLILLGFGVGAAQAEILETPEHLKEVVNAFIASNVTLGTDETMEVQFDQLSSYALPHCNNFIQADLPRDHNSAEITSVELSCHGTPEWHAYMPVHVVIYTKVLTAKTTIAPQEMITPDNVELGTHDKNRLYNGFFKDSDEIMGQVAAVVIQPGTVITKKNIQQPIIIHRNQTVDVTAIKNTVSVSMKGIAKSDGALHGIIKVLNVNSQKTFDAVVVGPSRAEVLL